MGIYRREFLRGVGLAAGAGLLGRPALLSAGVLKASDVVHLGPDRIRLSRLAMGLGTRAGSLQREMGLAGVADYLRYGYDQGVFFWDTADSYQTHPHVQEALKRVQREKVAIMTKTRARTADQMKTALDRFRQEMGTDYIDIVLLHAITSPTWPQECQGAMEALAEARQKGIVRTHGLSCHSLAALETTSTNSWARVLLASNQSRRRDHGW